MPYGLTNTPAVFQEFMNENFRDLVNSYITVYIDILVYSPTYDLHVYHVCTMLKWHLQHQLVTKEEKFHKDIITYCVVKHPSGLKRHSGLTPEAILPPSIIFAPVWSDIIEELQHAQTN